MSGALRARILEYLRAHHVATLAVADAAGPWAAAVFYAADADLGLVFLSDPGSRHGTAIAVDARAAATIQPSAVGWTEITGVQMEGRACALAGAERVVAERLYLERFPEIAALLRAPADARAQALAQRFAAASFYRFSPRFVRLIDNRRGFGHREELRLHAAAHCR